jgi:hypothetical protein
MTSLEIELRVSTFFGRRANLIVPNVSWGLNLHECDLLVLTKAGYATEVEIKTTKHDLLRDSRKRHQHRSPKIRRLFFAMPESMSGCVDLVPGHAGVILVADTGPRLLRRATINKAAIKWGDRERYDLARLGALRIWPLKETIWGANREPQPPEG